MNALQTAKRLKSGPVYLREELEGAVVRSVSGTAEFYAKFSGKEEYKIDFSTNLVTNALTAWDEITKSQYDKF